MQSGVQYNFNPQEFIKKVEVLKMTSTAVSEYLQDYGLDNIDFTNVNQLGTDLQAYKDAMDAFIS